MLGAGGAREGGFAFVVAPWSWLTGAAIDRGWVRRQSPADCHLLPGTRWVVTTTPADVYGLALSDPRVVGALRATAKSDLAWRREGYLAFRAGAEVDATAFSCTTVCQGRSPFWRDDEMGRQMALVQSNQCLRTNCSGTRLIECLDSRRVPSLRRADSHGRTYASRGAVMFHNSANNIGQGDLLWSDQRQLFGSVARQLSTAGRLVLD